MAEFYRFPQWILIALIMIAAACIVLQTLAVSYSVRRLHVSWVRRVENGIEWVVLAVLFLFAALLGQVQYGLYGSFLMPSAYCLARQTVFLLAAVLGTAAAVGTELIWPFFVIGGAAVLLPMTEKITGTAYPFFFLAALFYFFLRSVHICLMRREELYTQLSSVSIKEAIDSLHTGLLFFRPEGDILLCNRQMDGLARQLTGQPLYSGREFQNFLEAGKPHNGCVREGLGDQQVFRLRNASVWSITAYAVPMGRRTCVLLTADDVTAQWDAVKNLAEQNEALEKRGKELRHTIENLRTICETEEIAIAATSAIEANFLKTLGFIKSSFSPQSSHGTEGGPVVQSCPPPGNSTGDFPGDGGICGDPRSAAGGQDGGGELCRDSCGMRHQRCAPWLRYPHPVPLFSERLLAHDGHGQWHPSGRTHPGRRRHRWDAPPDRPAEGRHGVVYRPAIPDRTLCSKGG